MKTLAVWLLVAACAIAQINLPDIRTGNILARTDLTLNIGSGSVRFNQAHLGASNPLFLYRSTDTGNSLISFTVPGSSSSQWTAGATTDGSGAVWGILRAGTFATYWDANGVQWARAIRPIAGSTSSLGTSSARWVNTFSDSVTITNGFRLGTSSTVGQCLVASDTAGNGGWGTCTASFVPPSDATTDLGTSSLRFRSGYFYSSNPLFLYRSSDVENSLISFPISGSAVNDWSVGPAIASSSSVFGVLRGGSFATYWTPAGTQYTGALLPQAASSYSIGSNAVRYSNIYLDRLTLSTGASQGMGSNFVPAADATYNIGGGLSNRFLTLFSVRNLMQSTAGVNAGFQVYDSSGNLRVNTYDSGSGGAVEVYDSSGALAFNVTGSAIQINKAVTLSAPIVPSATNFYNIGSSVNSMNNGYFNRLFVNNTQGITTTVTVPCGTLTFTGGLLTNKGTC